MDEKDLVVACVCCDYQCAHEHNKIKIVHRKDSQKTALLRYFIGISYMISVGFVFRLKLIHFASSHGSNAVEREVQEAEEDDDKLKGKRNKHMKIERSQQQQPHPMKRRSSQRMVMYRHTILIVAPE